MVIKTGVYSDRIYEMCRFAKKQFKKIEKIEYIDWKKINNYKKKLIGYWHATLKLVLV